MKRYLKSHLSLLNPILGIFFPLVDFNSRWFSNSPTGYLWCLRSLWQKNILRLSTPYPFPTSITCKISNPDNIRFHPDNLDNFQSEGTYFQVFDAKIVIGEGTYISHNVGIITSNHDPRNLDVHLPGKDVIIGKNCWLGMNCIILPGVVLPDNTIVGAGAVVTKSPSSSGCTIVGVPAKSISISNNSQK